MSAKNQETQKLEWIAAAEVAAILGGIKPKHVPRLAAEGLITSRPLPGVSAIYLRSDVERLAVQSVRPARA
jgi:hypothetical protein